MRQLDSRQPNMIGNLSIENPTVAQLNTAVSGCATRLPDNSVDPAFGEHVKEAAHVVKRLFGL
jgi:hypothetical protein